MILKICTCTSEILYDAMAAKSTTDENSDELTVKSHEGKAALSLSGKRQHVF